MKSSIVALLAAIIAAAVVTDAKLRNGFRFKKWEMSESKPSKNKELPESSSSEEEASENNCLRRVFKEQVLHIEGLDEPLSDAELIYLEDLILKNAKAASPDDQNMKMHSLIFSGSNDGRQRKITGSKHFDIYVFTDYRCNYCPNDDEYYPDDWVKPTRAPSPPTRAPTKVPENVVTRRPTARPTESPSASPSVDVQNALKKTNISKLGTNLCAGTQNSQFTAIRKITGCTLN